MKSLMNSNNLLIVLLLAIVCGILDCQPIESEREPGTQSGTDSSWPMQHAAQADTLSNEATCPEQLQLYQKYMKGCSKRYTKEMCDRNDKERIAYNLNQPRQQTNFTSAGYAKLKAPTQVYNILRDYWKLHNKTRSRPEDWDAGNIYVNHWQVPTTVVPIDGLSKQHRQIVAEQLKATLEQWSQTTLIPTSTYGIRVYHRGAILAPHVDRLPLVISAIVNVAQAADMDEAWPLEVIGHDGKARNITLEPGEMILYESHSVIHGRPYPLAGEYYANVFVHFEPLHYSQELEQRITQQSSAWKRSPKELFELALAKLGDLTSSSKSKPSARGSKSSLPDYIQEGSEEAKRWRQEFVFYREEKKQDKAPPTKYKVKGVTPAHAKAANGSAEDMKKIFEADPESLHKADANGWKPIHEAARGGNTEVVAFLLRKGADVNERTNKGKGANALWWAKQSLEDDHPLIRLLERNGGVPIGPNE